MLSADHPKGTDLFLEKLKTKFTHRVPAFGNTQYNGDAYNLGQEFTYFFLKGPNSDSLGFAGHESSAATAEPRHVGGKAATDNLKTNGQGLVPIKLYLQDLWKVSFDTGAACVPGKVCPSLQSSPPPEYNKVSLKLPFTNSKFSYAFFYLT